MGLFSRKRTITVASVAYNLAGDINKRVKFLPTVIMSHLIKNDASASMADSIVNSLISGPGTKFRSFGRWARTSGYTSLIHQTSGGMYKGNTLDFDLIADNIDHDPDQVVVVQTAECRAADYGYWADQWMAENHPLLIDDDYVMDFNESTNTISIYLDDGITVYTFNPVDFDPHAEYLYVSYLLQKENQILSVEVGDDESGSWPHTTGVEWELVDTITTPQSTDLHTNVETVITYSDATPGSTDTDDYDTATPWDSIEDVWNKTEYMGQDIVEDQTYSIKTIQHNFTNKIIDTVVDTDVTTEDIGGGVIKTTTVTTTSEVLIDEFSYRIDTQKIIYRQWGSIKFFIYKQDSGNTDLDTLFTTEILSSEYFPFIPIYIDNAFVTGDIKVANKKAVKKAMGAKYDKLQAMIADNPSLGDIDYAYIIFGVPLNTKEKASIKYLYKFFESALVNDLADNDMYESWKLSWLAANESKHTWILWKAAQSDGGNPLYNTVEPIVIPYPPTPLHEFRLSSELYNLNIRISWSNIVKTTHVGLGKIGAKRGDCWTTFEEVATDTINLYSGGLAKFVANILEKRGVLTITWQLTENTYTSIAISDLHYENIIYGGKSVGISIKDAMNDEDESGFIIPIDETIYHQISLTNATQMSNSIAYILFNCYTIRKQKWYETSLFKLILIIIIIIISIYFPPAAGLLGSAATIGAAVGLTGIAAIVVGTIVNMIAAMILTRIIMTVSTKLLGDKVGSIVGAIVSVIAIAYGSAPSDGVAGMASVFSTLSDPQTLLNIASATGQGVAQYLNSKTMGVLSDLQKVLTDYNEQSKKVAEMWERNLGYGRTYIDPMEFTEIAKADNPLYITEPVNTFLSRTLILGTDIVEITHSMLTNFASITLSNHLLI